MYCHYILNISVKDLKYHTDAHKSTIYRWITKTKNVNWKDKNTYMIDFKKIIKIKRKIYLKKSKNLVINLIDKYMQTHKFIQIKNIIRQIKNNCNLNIQKSTVYNIIKKLNYTYKKVRLNKVLGKDIIEHNMKVEKLKKNINEHIKDNKEIWSLDESAFYINMINEYGWSKEGTRCIHDRENRERTRYTLELLISNNSVIKYKIYKGSLNKIKFDEFLNGINYEAKPLIILDNASIHTADKIKNGPYKEYLLYNVPYSPETNPIEMAFSKIKNLVKKQDNSTEEKLYKNIERGVKSLRAEDLQGFFNKSFS